MKNNQKGFIGLPVLIVILLGIVVLGGGAYFAVHQQPSSQTVSPIPYSQSDVAKQASLKEARGNISRVVYMELYAYTCNREKYGDLGVKTREECFKIMECVADKFAFSIPAEIAAGVALDLMDYESKGRSIESYFDSHRELLADSRMDRATVECSKKN